MLVRVVGCVRRREAVACSGYGSIYVSTPGWGRLLGMGGVRGWRGGEGAKGTRILGLGGAPKVGLLGEIMGSMAVKVGSTGAKMGSPNLGDRLFCCG